MVRNTWDFIQSSFILPVKGTKGFMAWDPIWENVFSSQTWGKYPGEDLIRFIARHFYHANPRNQVKILEVGCGPGANLWFMAREGFTVYGIDGSKTAIDIALTRLNEECPNWKGELHVGDITRLPFPEEFFDAVVDNEAIYCNSFEQSIDIYNELARVTKKNGKLFSRTFATGCWGDGTGEQVGYNAFIVEEGPMKGKGYTRFTKYEDIPLLITKFSIKEIQLLSRKYMDTENEIKEWIIIGEK